MASPIEISCDESHNHGENLIRPSARVFAVGSHDLSADEARTVMSWVRAETGSPATEIKSSAIKRMDEPFHDELFDQRLRGRSRVYLVDTTYFIVGKVVDLLIEELAYFHGHDLYSGDEARKMASSFYRQGARAVGTERWEELLKSFNSLMRVNSRSEPHKTTIEEFFELVSEAHAVSHRQEVTTVLELVLRAKPFAQEFQDSLGAAVLPALNPLVPSIAQVAREWFGQHRAEIEIRFDDADVLKRKGAVDALLGALRKPTGFERYVKPIKISDIQMFDSKADPQIQVADLLSGFGTRVSAAAHANEASDLELNLLRPLLTETLLWGDDVTWRRLKGRLTRM